ncbi:MULTISPECIES: FAD-dependent monooxygenase [Sorangium]|uniref:FAD-binding monooxygenase n=1 Tax=Sorangium cellulosum TaxID=56 RepID=A0A4P2QDY7_SORCE|nr:MULTISPECIES: FAD-dependent monooxygenase [Sorangium]AUX28017.1 FAD-binding monooxygenase [Sorangium cellulosum]WCQ87422.1 Pentachlorophenol 4-monooxygenase [Sorangium sp. Soce836]
MAGALDALVVGGGPTGLTMAGELARRGLTVRIVDKAPEPPSDHSRALAVQTRTMELFRRMGIVDLAMERAVRVGGINVLLSNERRARLSIFDFPELSTPIPGIFILQQFDTERVLASRLSGLGVTLERGVGLASYTQDSAGVTCTLRRADGSSEEVRARWLLGCDGAHSPVRKGADIAFEGDTYDDHCMLGDLIIDWPLPDGDIYISPSRRGVAAAFPVPGSHRFRVILIRPEPPPTHDAQVSPEEFEAAMREMIPVPFKVQQAIVLSRYRLHHRVAARLRKGRVFLAGDAAHIHSPAGGQGMNTGIQDAYNLAWKLAAVEQGRMPAWLLDTYEVERLPVARRLIGFTDRLFGLMAGHGPVGRTLRAIAPRLASRALGISAVQRRILGFVSQLKIRYRKSPLSVQIGSPPAHGPRAGDRAPDAVVRSAAGEQVHLFDLMRDAELTLLLFTGTQADGGAREHARKLAAQLGRPDLEVLVIGALDGGGFADPDGHAHAAYGVASSAAVLVRPDGYVGVRSDPLDEGELRLALGRLFTRSPEAA